MLNDINIYMAKDLLDENKTVYIAKLNGAIESFEDIKDVIEAQFEESNDYERRDNDSAK